MILRQVERGDGGFNRTASLGKIQTFPLEKLFTQLFSLFSLVVMKCLCIVATSMVLLKISQFHMKTSVSESLFNKVACPQA